MEKKKLKGMQVLQVMEYKNEGPKKQRSLKGRKKKREWEETRRWRREEKKGLNMMMMMMNLLLSRFNPASAGVMSHCS
jgi:hypothetical protein